MEKYFMDGNVTTCEEKLKTIHLKKEQEKKNRYEENQTKLSEYLKVWFKSCETKTDQFDCNNYSKEFLDDLKLFVENKHYFFNMLVKDEISRGMFGHPECGYVNSFIIATYKVDEREFKLYSY